MIDVDVARRVGSFNLKVSFRNDNGITALFGRSGAGKSLTIGLIAGLDRPDRGHVVLDGRALVDTDKGVFLPAYRRHIGMVFQDSHLFPHLGVAKICSLGAGLRRVRPGPSASMRSSRLWESVSFSAERRPNFPAASASASPLARALLSGPQLLLMDEPLAALDRARRLEILPLIERLRDDFKIPIVYVSHDVEEVARLASRVVVLDQGHVVAIGGPSRGLADSARR